MDNRPSFYDKDKIKLDVADFYCLYLLRHSMGKMNGNFAMKCLLFKLLNELLYFFQCCPRFNGVVKLFLITLFLAHLLKHQFNRFPIGNVAGEIVLELSNHLLKTVKIFPCIEIIRCRLSPCLIKLLFGLVEKLLYQRFSKEPVRLLRFLLLLLQRSLPFRPLLLPLRLALE